MPDGATSQTAGRHEVEAITGCGGGEEEKSELRSDRQAEACPTKACPQGWGHGSLEGYSTQGRLDQERRGRQMDLQVYYQKIRELETKIADEFPLMVSMETADGGKGGTKTEVPRRLAAKMLVEGMARLASKDEVKAHREALVEAKRSADRAAAAARVQLTVLSTTELDRLRSEARSTKE